MLTKALQKKKREHHHVIIGRHKDELSRLLSGFLFVHSHHGHIEEQFDSTAFQHSDKVLWNRSVTQL